MLPGYEQAIFEATSCPQEDATHIEDLMRLQIPTGTLDGITARRFDELARVCQEALKELRLDDPNWSLHKRSRAHV
jgi:hypothetical protein